MGRKKTRRTDVDELANEVEQVQHTDLQGYTVYTKVLFQALTESDLGNILRFAVYRESRPTKVAGTILFFFSGGNPISLQVQTIPPNVYLVVDGVEKNNFFIVNNKIDNLVAEITALKQNMENVERSVNQQRGGETRVGSSINATRQHFATIAE